MFYFISPIYNAEKWAKNCLDSIVSQQRKDWRAIFINDGSRDKTGDIIKEYTNIDERIKLINNESNNGRALGNLVDTINNTEMDQEDVIISLDGDDWLANNSVLDTLYSVYENKNIWLTYGQYEPASKEYSNYCRPINDTRTYRRIGKWTTSHLKSFRRKLFDKIPNEAFRDPRDGNKYYSEAWDHPMMFPMIEVAGLNRIKFIDTVLYIYNDLNDLNEMKIRSQKQLNTASYVRSLPIFEEFK